jgi:hypothetical protein
MSGNMDPLNAVVVGSLGNDRHMMYSLSYRLSADGSDSI